MADNSSGKKLTDHQAKYFAHELQRSYANDHVGKLAGLLFDAQVEPKPHQIDAALFALQTPFLPGVILADEVGLGKTIEAGIVISQYWAERKRRILIIAPSSLRQQWKQELHEKFMVQSELLDSKSRDRLLQAQDTQKTQVLICSYEFVLRNEAALSRHWDLVVADEAHRLRNFWNGDRAKMPSAVSRVVRNANKTVLLTATPLQNRLDELYGLVSIFDPNYFHSLDAFRERYVKNREDFGDDDLVERVATISKRTLRRDADKYIRFTTRSAITVEFTPSDEEIRLYDLVNDYLQREQLFAFAGSQRHLSALIIRKRLGSSTYAVAGTLENIASRLEEELTAGMRRSGSGALVLDDDLYSEEVEELDDSAPASNDLEDAPLKERIRIEVEELREYATLARSITVNQKAVKLGEALDQGFERLREIGAPEKAIIFTDSTKTQEYIARTLHEAGRGEGLVLFNGKNDSPEAIRIHNEWVEHNKDGDLITGNRDADRRKALVDYFRDKGTIMIATEAAAEGLNLQFCSMLVNYDLPWNPQRVEQRIGRVHRFGQKHNVVVVNFSNKGNVAEQRILELLTEKFHLFESVFGASDQVLGAIEDGLDFEKNITAILNRCKTAEEIDAAFAELEDQYSDEISQEMTQAKSKVFDNLDPNVQDRLKSYDTQSGEVLNKFERLLLAVTQHELSEDADFETDGRQFTLRHSPVPEAKTGRYFFKSKPQENAHQYRYSSALAEYVIDSAKEHSTPPRELTFSLSASDRAGAAVKQLEGKSGELTVNLVTFSMRAKNDDISESYMLAGGFVDGSNDWIDTELVNDLLELTATEVSEPDLTIDEDKFADKLAEQRAEYEREVQGRNAKHYNQQEEILDRNIKDRRAEFDAKVRDYRKKESEARKAAKNTDNPLEEIKLKREASKWRSRADEAESDHFMERKKLREEAEELLDLIEQALTGTQETEHLFSIRWRVVA